ncbi:MAG TPA: hypothetical protein IAA52_00570 [Candidatus Pullichristensenella stercorigallinarum]|uniref:Uncharacterized protein n=1 Tax=Candidatus Pullichristensenella stercorigallinarum TaxID=2840909 RepID=A0A9D0ZJT3_9FIRM|nr:hypothetical protein [Candidatus Pullichristensenella stercorigallinarum]
MKKLTVLFMIVMLLGVTVYAEDLQVQIIGGEDVPQATLDLDDMQLGQTYEIDGYARIAPVSFEYKDVFIQYGAGYPGDASYAIPSEHENADITGKVRFGDAGGPYFESTYYKSIYWQESGETADFAWLQVDLTNMQKEAVNFMKEATVKVIFDDEYELAGWVRQLNYDYDTERQYGAEGVEEHNPETEEYENTYGTLIRAALDPADEQPAEMLYTGHYVFGCTLPTAVINGTEPLSMVIDLGGNELTYNIR